MGLLLLTGGHFHDGRLEVFGDVRGGTSGPRVFVAGARLCDSVLFNKAQ